jgi:hypothetical protein
MRTKGLVDFPDYTQRRRGMAARIEENVMPANVVGIEKFSPDPGDRLLDGSRWVLVIARTESAGAKC